MTLLVKINKYIITLPCLLTFENPNLPKKKREQVKLQILNVSCPQNLGAEKSVTWYTIAMAPVSQRVNLFQILNFYPKACRRRGTVKMVVTRRRQSRATCLEAHTRAALQLESTIDSLSFRFACLFLFFTLPYLES